MSGHQAFALAPMSCSPTETSAADNPLFSRALVAAVFTEADSCTAASMSAAPSARVNAELSTHEVHTISCRAANNTAPKANLVPPYTSLPASRLGANFLFRSK